MKNLQVVQYFDFFSQVHRVTAPFFQAQNKLDLQNAQSQSQIALAKLQAQAQQQAAALAFQLQQQKASAAAAAAATAAALKELRRASAAAQKQQQAALDAVKAADAAAITKVKSDAEAKIAAVRKAAEAASAAIAVQSATTRKLNRKLRDHVSDAKRLFRDVNKAIDKAASFQPVPGPRGPRGSRGLLIYVGFVFLSFVPFFFYGLCVCNICVCMHRTNRALLQVFPAALVPWALLEKSASVELLALLETRA